MKVDEYTKLRLHLGRIGGKSVVLSHIVTHDILQMSERFGKKEENEGERGRKGGRRNLKGGNDGSEASAWPN